MIEIADGIFIDEQELVFKASRSAGPGGQNVNKVNSRVTLLFDVARCPALSAEQKQRILRRLATRTSKAGVLRIVSQKHRTQKANRIAATQRLGELLSGALRRSPPRKETVPTASAREKRLDDKKRRGQLKRQRAGVDWRRDVMQ